MKTKLTQLAIIISFFGISINLNSQTKITLTNEMIINEKAFADAYALIDEQNIAGDPLNSPGTAGAPSTSFQSWKDPQLYHYPITAIIDLGTDYNITGICTYEPSGIGTYSVSHGVPFGTWTQLYTESVSGGSWKSHTTNFTARYVKVTINTSGVFLGEIVLYGSQIGPTPTPVTPTQHPYALMEHVIGANSFVDDRLHLQKALGNLREYHNWLWNEGDYDLTYAGYPNNECEFSPSANGNWYWDDFYQSRKNAGIEVYPCVQNTAFYMCDTCTTLNEHRAVDKYKPLQVTDDPEVPSSYVEHADFLYQFAARYGSQTVSNSNLKLASNQVYHSGLNTVEYIENWNEQDKSWEEVHGYFSPYQYIAMTSADYDGHLGSMGNTVGVKNADPNMKLVMGGIYKLNLEYVRAMKFWCDFNRGGSFPMEAINVHHYCTDAGQQGGGATTGISPEDDNLKDKLKVWVDYRDKYLPGVEVWLSEFGYDSDPRSDHGVQTYGGFDGEEVQGQWLVRCYLAIAAAGIDKAQMFMLRDVDSHVQWRFATCGLVEDWGNNYKPKKSWYYVYTMKETLKGRRFKREIPSGNPNVWIYEFANDNGDSSVYAVWCPTTQNQIENNYSLNLGSGAISATQVTLAVGDSNGVHTPLTISGNAVTINVTEKAQFIEVYNPSNTTTEEELSNKNFVKVFPTVANAGVNVFVDYNIEEEDLSLEVNDLNGKLIHSQALERQTSGLKKSVKLNADIFNKGVYLVTIKNPRKVIHTERVIIK